MERRARPGWASLPPGLRRAVQVALRSPVIGTVSMPGGWSPGIADRLRLADGRTAFVKAADADVNAETIRLHRREAAVLQALAGTGAAPGLLGSVDDGSWFAILTDDVGGRHPEPADERDTCAVLDAVASLPRPSPPLPAPADLVRDVFADLADDWRRLLEAGAAGTVPGGDPVVLALRRAAVDAPSAVEGDGLAHLDLRVDNALITGRGAVLVDWPYAGVGAAWVDGVTYLLDVHRLRRDGRPFEIPPHPLFAGVPGEAVDAVIAALAGYFFERARRPEPPELPGIRGFQREQGDVLIEVLRDRGRVLSRP